MLTRTARVGLRPLTGLAFPYKGSLSVLNLVCTPLSRPWQARQWSGQALAVLHPQYDQNTIENLRRIRKYILTPTMLRNFSTTPIRQKEATEVSSPEDTTTDLSKRDNPEDITLGFERTEKGEAAREVDLSARLKDRSPQSEKGEVWRLLRLAGREWRTLTGFFSLIL